MAHSESTPSEPAFAVDNDAAAGRALIAELRTLLGAKLVAYLAGIPDTRTVREWADGTRGLPEPTILDRLQVALKATQLVTKLDTPSVAQAWFQGRNPALDDKAPAQRLRDVDLDRAGRLVLEAAREFATHGSN
jgi:hypothetical protein